LHLLKCKNGKTKLCTLQHINTDNTDDGDVTS